MVFVVAGLSHKTAPLSVREKLALPEEKQQQLLQHFLELPEVNEAFMVSTCNRVEWFYDATAPIDIGAFISKQIPDFKNYIAYLYQYEGLDAMRHSLRVASGLEAMMLGEAQILGQIKKEYQKAYDNKTVGRQLQPVFDYLFNAVKQVRHQSGIGDNPVSVASIAAQLVKQQFKNLNQLHILLIGSGETTTLVAKYLLKEGVGRFSIASRTEAHAARLASPLSGSIIPITDIESHLDQVDAVISATSCPLPFITKHAVETVLINNPGKNLFFIDLAMPRDIDAAVSDLDRVRVYNLDDLQTIVDHGKAKRMHNAIKAEALIEKHLTLYTERMRQLQAKQTIYGYREQMEKMATKEYERALAKLSTGADASSVLKELSHRLFQKLTHHPTRGLQTAASQGREDLLALTHYLFLTENNYPYEEIV